MGRGKQAEQEEPAKLAPGFVPPGSRLAAGTFAPGASGNPGGRPRGSRNRISRECADLLAADAAPIFARLVRLAKKGDPIGLRLAVERLLPARGSRDRFVQFELGELRSAADLVAAAAAVIQHAAAGEITMSEAREFMGLIETQRKTIETADLAVRLEALEGGAGPGVGPGEVDPDLGARVRRLSRDTG
jgi:hypothetical protein